MGIVKKYLREQLGLKENGEENREEKAAGGLCRVERVNLSATDSGPRRAALLPFSDFARHVAQRALAARRRLPGHAPDD